jgi:hypothetical protein
MIGESGIRGSVGIFGSVGISGGVGIGASAGGGGSPLPPIRPDSYLKYTFSQTNLESAITDRVTGTDQLTTTIGTDVNVIQTIDGGVRTFEFGENLLPASLLNWVVDGGNATGTPIFTNDSGLGEVAFSIASLGQRSYCEDSFFPVVGDNVFSLVVIGTIANPLRVRDVFYVNGIALGDQFWKVNGVSVSGTDNITFEDGDVLEVTFNTIDASSSRLVRFGLGTLDGNIAAGASIKLTQPMVNSGTERGPFVQPNGNPVIDYQQAFDVGVGALIEPSAVNLLPYSRDFTQYTKNGSADVEDSQLASPFGGFYTRVFNLNTTSDTLVFRYFGQTPGEPLSVNLYLAKGSGTIRIGTGSGAAVGEWVIDLTQISEQGERVDINHPSVTVVFPLVVSGSGSGGILIGNGTASEVKIDQIDQVSGVDNFVGSPILTDGSPKPRDASTPTVPADNIPNSETVVYNEYIHLATYDEPRLLWAYADTRTQAAIGVIDSGNGLGDTLQLIRIDGTGTTLTPLSVTMTQGISRDDRVLTKAYLKSDLFTLVVENQTTGETQSASDASIAGNIGGLGPIVLGDAGAVASTFSRKIIDFEITSYTNP